MSLPSKTAKAWLAFGFGTVAGYVDVICLIRFSAFGTMMTGNLLMIAKSIMDPIEHSKTPLPTPIFFSMIILTRGIGLLLHYMFDKTKLGVAIFLTPLLVAMVVASEVTAYMQYLPYAERWIVCIVSMIFGVQSAVTHPSLGVPTILATGHMTNMFYIFLAAILQQPDADLSKALLPGCVVSGMMGGAVVGAYAIHTFKGTAMLDLSLTPIMVIQGILVVIVECISKWDDASTMVPGALQLTASTSEVLRMESGALMLAPSTSEVLRYNKLPTEAPQNTELNGGEQPCDKLAAA